ncbi:small nuclear ribonucleoprotein F [Blastomyces dermatitidis ER-3]|uniref:Sm protein F n=1 Tax=Ajellomyces dermatitidis (strain ER-3 / ATCC MYA-2586) TaxID=559297 RepID=A0ABP2F2H5_AJEDR|nr:small nuclear ribonucleoprotein F [Blastomyces dermatitidis ER-3]EEQ90996.2 small nuclear ribonucleoprotein F [Blastomyces dermatitidis ER-3]
MNRKARGKKSSSSIVEGWSLRSLRLIVDLSDGEWYDYDEKAGEEFVPLNPRPMLQSLVNEDIIVHLKWGQTEYKGQLVSVDSYMNIQLSNTEEFIDGKSTGSLGQVLIRCNNVLWISAAKGVEMKDVQMSEG